MADWYLEDRGRLYNQPKKTCALYVKKELPEIKVIDMNNFKPSSKSWISKQIYDETLKNLKDKNQVLFFFCKINYQNC